jgi:hypothetical protein
MKLASKTETHDFAVLGLTPQSFANELMLSNCPILPAQSFKKRMNNVRS